MFSSFYDISFFLGMQYNDDETNNNDEIPPSSG